MIDLNSRRQLKLAVEIAELGLGEVNYLDDTISFDVRGAELFEVKAFSPIPRSIFYDKLHPEDRENVELRVQDMLSPDGDDYIMLQHRVISSDGDIRWLRARKQVYYDDIKESGNPRAVSGLVVIEDITSFKEAETRIQYLMGEVSHRAKNMLSVVQGIARMTARNSEPADFMKRFTARLTALSSNQLVLIDDKWSQTNVLRLAQTQLKPYSIGIESRVTFEGPYVVLQEKSAQAIGMALHELATNAVKYGALSTDAGEIKIKWSVTDGDKGKNFVITWQESNGPTVAAPTRKGFGDTVVRQMAASSVAGIVTLDYNPAGVRWSLTAPLSNVST